MIGNKARGGRALRIAVGMAALVLLMAGGAGSDYQMPVSRPAKNT